MCLSERQCVRTKLEDRCRKPKNRASPSDTKTSPVGRSAVPSHVGGHTKIKENKAPLFGSSLQKSCAASLCPRCFFLSKALSYSLLTSTQEFLACHTIHARCLGALVLWLEDNSSMFLITTTPCMRHIPVQLRSDCLQNCGRVVDDILRLTDRP